ncbi:unnamed protein product [Ixodes hexagonus]
MSQDLKPKEANGLHCPGEMGDSWTFGAPSKDAFPTNNSCMVTEPAESKSQSYQPSTSLHNLKESGDYTSDEITFDVSQRGWVADELTGFFKDIAPFTDHANEHGFESNFCTNSLERCDSDSTINEYMTPAGSQFSINSLVVEGPEDVSLLHSHDDVADVFCSSLEVFPSSNPIPVPQVKSDRLYTIRLSASSKSSSTSPTESIDLNEDPEPIAECRDCGILILQAGYTEENEVQSHEQSVTILDISDQRVNFINSPSALSLISGHGPPADHLLEESYQDRILEEGYQQLNSNSSLESKSTNANTPTDGSPCSSICESSPILETAQLQLTGNDSSTASISHLLSMSAARNARDRAELRKQQRDGSPRPQQNGLQSWTWLKRMVRRRFQTIRSRVRGKKAKQASKGPSRFLGPSKHFLGSSQLCEESLEDDGIDVFGLGSPEGQKKAASDRPCLRIRDQGDDGIDDNVSSDEFYTSSGKWDLKGMYQRFMSYVHNVWGRRS